MCYDARMLTTPRSATGTHDGTGDGSIGQAEEDAAVCQLSTNF
jgi:hypothetical protein